MLCDNIKPNLNISKLVTDGLHTNIKFTNNIKMNRLLSPLQLIPLLLYRDHYIIFIDRVPEKCKDEPIFSSYAQNYFFSIKM